MGTRRRGAKVFLFLGYTSTFRKPRQLCLVFCEQWLLCLQAQFDSFTGKPISSDPLFPCLGEKILRQERTSLIPLHVLKVGRGA